MNKTAIFEKKHRSVAFDKERRRREQPVQDGGGRDVDDGKERFDCPRVDRGVVTHRRHDRAQDADRPVDQEVPRA